MFMVNRKRTFKNYILVMVPVVALIIILTGCTKHTPTVVTTEEYDPYATAVELLAVIKEMDLDAGTMSFVTVDNGRQYDLLYNNGVDIRNKYDDIMSASKLSVGQVVDVTYSAANNKILEIAINPDAWEIRNISGFTFDRIKRQATILGRTYQYSNDLVVYSDGKLISDSEVCREDELTARGYGGKLLSLTVDLGHGYVRLEDYDTYIGGMIEIGYDVIVPVTENMLLTVREGNYKLQITKGAAVGYKSIAVVRDQESTVSLKELQIAPASTGTMFFDVSPEFARVMIDGETIDTNETMELIYGKHRIRITADGYETKEGYFTVNSAYRIMTIELSRDGEDLENLDDTSTEADSTETDDTSTSQSTISTASTEAAETTTSSTASTSTEASSEATTETTTEATDNTVTIENPVGVYCYLDGTYVGIVPCTFQKTVGSHVIALSMNGCYTKSYTIQCTNDGKDDTYSFDALKTYQSTVLEEDE